MLFEFFRSSAKMVEVWRPVRGLAPGCCEARYQCYDAAQGDRISECVLIDNPDKVHSLIANLESNLPLRARITPRLAESLREKSPGTVVPQECDVAAVHYAGDEGGILCALDFGDDTMEKVHIVSITHLAFHRGSPYARDIEVYQRHRIKKIRRLQFRG